MAFRYPIKLYSLLKHSCQTAKHEDERSAGTLKKIVSADNLQRELAFITCNFQVLQNSITKFEGRLSLVDAIKIVEEDFVFL